MNYLNDVYYESINGRTIPEPTGYWEASGISTILKYLPNINLEEGVFDKLKKITFEDKCKFNYEDNAISTLTSMLQSELTEEFVS